MEWSCHEFFHEAAIPNEAVASYHACAHHSIPVILPQQVKTKPLPSDELCVYEAKIFFFWG